MLQDAYKYITFLNMNSSTRSYIRELRAKGYEIKLPGGTSRDGKHASFASMIKKRYRNGAYTYTIIVIPYIPLMKGVKRKESKERVFPETPEQTLEREVLEETGNSLAKGVYKEIGRIEFDDDREGHEGEKHQQINFLCAYFDDSNMRTTFSVNEKNIGIPFVVELDDELERYIASSHKWMIRDVRDYISVQPRNNLNLKKLPLLKKRYSQPVQ